MFRRQKTNGAFQYPKSAVWIMFPCRKSLFDRFVFLSGQAGFPVRFANEAERLVKRGIVAEFRVGDDAVFDFLAHFHRHGIGWIAGGFFIHFSSLILSRFSRGRLLAATCASNSASVTPPKVFVGASVRIKHHFPRTLKTFPSTFWSKLTNSPVCDWTFTRPK